MKTKLAVVLTAVLGFAAATYVFAQEDMKADMKADMMDQDAGMMEQKEDMMNSEMANAENAPMDDAMEAPTMNAEAPVEPVNNGY